MPICTLCSRSFKTRGTLGRYQRLIHDGKCTDDSVPPVCVSLTYFVNLSQQPLKCPLCPFVRKRCKNVNSVAAHFRQSHSHHQLCVSYHCQWCDSHIDPAEIRIHARSHALHRCAGQPFSPPIPQINPADGSLSFIDTSGHVYDAESVPDFPPGCGSSSPPSLSLLAPPQDVTSVCASFPSTSTQPAPSPATLFSPLHLPPFLLVPRSHRKSLRLGLACFVPHLAPLPLVISSLRDMVCAAHWRHLQNILLLLSPLGALPPPIILILINAPAVESTAACSVPVVTSVSDVRSEYLLERNSALLQLKQACVWIMIMILLLWLLLKLVMVIGV